MKLETIIKKSDIKFNFVEYNGNWIYEKGDNLYYFEKANEVEEYEGSPFFDWTKDRELKLVKKYKRVYEKE